MKIIKIGILLIITLGFNFNLMAQINIDNNYEDYYKILFTFDDWNWAWHTVDRVTINNSAIKVKKNNKWGVIKIVEARVDSETKLVYNKLKPLIIPITYEDIGSFNLNQTCYIPVKQNGKWGIIDTFLNTKVEFKYDSIKFVLGNYEYFKIKINGKWGLINFNDVNKFPSITYDYIDDIYLDKVIVVQNKKYGIINLKSNAEISPCKYDYIQQTYWEENYFTAELNKKRTLIDPNGKEIVPIIYDNIFPTYNDLSGYYPMAMVVKGKKYGLIDLNGKEIYPCIYEDIDFENYFSKNNLPPPSLH